MSMFSEKNGQFIYFLKFSKEISPNYIRLADLFNKFGISLVPININDVAPILKSSSERPFILTLTTNLRSLLVLRKLQAKFLDMAVLSKKVNHLDINSFAPSKFIMRGKQKKTYFFYELPLPFFKIVKDCSVHYFDQANSVSKWPGGIKNRTPRADLKRIKRFTW